MALRIPAGAFGIIKEVARHLLRRPVVGFVVLPRTANGDVVLIRRGDTGGWALPGGTLEWGETLRQGLPRELLEETGCELLAAQGLLGVYSSPDRDPRFHAVSVVVGALVAPPSRPPMNPLEILEVKCFAPDALPPNMSHGLSDVARRALAGEIVWE